MPRVVPSTARVTVDAAQVLAYAVFWFVVITLGFSLAGLTLAVFGVFTPVFFAIAGTIGTGTLGAMSWSAFRRAVRDLLQGGVLPVVAVLLIAAASSLSAGVFSAEHVLTNRDPGVYVTTARWLADEGSLLVDGASGGFEGIEGITGQSLGYYEVRADGLLNPQFMHLLPIWGAAAQWLGGDQALFRVNAVIIAGAIGAFWLFAALLVRPWFAVLATAGLAVNLVTVHFARDVYSEPLTMMLVFAALSLFVVAEYAENFGLSMVTGILVGTTAAARIDAWLVIIAFALYLEVRWFAVERRGDRTAIRRFVQPVLLGMMVGAAAALLDGVVRSTPYLLAHRTQFLGMIGLLVVVLLGGTIARLPALVNTPGTRFEAARRIAAWAVPLLIGVSAILLFFVRPAIQETHGVRPNPVVALAQMSEGLPSDSTRSYAEWSLRWLSWYLGVGGFTAGVAGLAIAWRRAILGRRVLMPVLLVASITTAVFVLRPSISPDQLWAMRRFLPITIPALILAATLLADWGFDRWRSSAQRSLTSIAAVILLVLVPASFAWPLGTATAHRGMYGLTAEVCDALPSKSALLLVSGTHTKVFQAAVRSFCGVPVAGIDASTADPAIAIEEAQVAWAEEGVILYVGEVSGNRIGSTAIETSFEFPEIVLTRRPEISIGSGFAIDIAPAVSPQFPSGG